jgi:ATP-dependent Clp protease ATP-binding subunit ClpA
MDLDLLIQPKSGIESFTRDLTSAALRDELEPVRCRDAEIERVITILLRQSKNNPVLVGAAGVGKTAIAEGLAKRISERHVPQALKAARILSLSHIDLIAGSTFRGQYEKRLQAVVNEVSADPNAILFIDELHNLIGAGSALGAPMDAANMLKPALASGELRVIGATTEIEYERYIRADGALERRFNPVRVDELGNAETLEVLKARGPRLEAHHLLALSEDAFEAAVSLSIKYLPDRKQPDRSIDLLDETCARFRMQQDKPVPEEVERLSAEREAIRLAERKIVDEMLALAEARGTSFERLSRGTQKVFESLGAGVEKLLTGQSSPRQPEPVPESIRRLQASDPAGRLSGLHCQRLQIEDRLKTLLVSYGLTVTDEHVRATVDQQGACPGALGLDPRS